LERDRVPGSLLERLFKREAIVCPPGATVRDAVFPFISQSTGFKYIVLLLSEICGHAYWHRPC
jgi:hypothetical protein